MYKLKGVVNEKYVVATCAMGLKIFYYGLYEMLCAIWYYLYNFKNKKNTLVTLTKKNIPS